MEYILISKRFNLKIILRERYFYFYKMDSFHYVQAMPADIVYETYENRANCTFILPVDTP